MGDVGKSGAASRVFFETGAVIAGRYRIGTLLGTGGMASVYRAHDTRLDRDVAIKILEGWSLEDIETTRERFDREARALAAIDSPYVVPIYDAGRDGDLWFLVEKLLPGVGLDAFMRAERPPLQMVVALISDALAGLQALHRAGVIHRDVTPPNIFVVDGCRAVLIDLGIALTGQQRLTERNLVLGTPEFMSPEQTTGADPDARSDVYALGLVLLYAASGQPELAEADTLIQRRLAGDEWLDVELPCVVPALRPILRRALARDPARRFPSAAAMRAALLEPMDLDAPETARIARIVEH